MKDFAVTMKLHNNLLKERRVSLGLSCPKMAAEIGVRYGLYVSYENLTYLRGTESAPWNPRRREWTKAAIIIANYWKALPEDLFPASVLAVTKNKVEFEVSTDEMCALTSNFSRIATLPPSVMVEEHEFVETLGKAVSKLGARERFVVECICQDRKPLRVVAESIGRSEERVRQIYHAALWKLRNGTYVKELKEHYHNAEDV